MAKGDSSEHESPPSRNGKSYERFLEKLREIATLGSIGALLGWDQQLHLPPNGQRGRAEQQALISRLSHEAFVDTEMSDLLDALEESEATLSPEAAVNVREIRRAYDRQKKLPSDLVDKISRAFSRGYEAWEKASEKSDFAIFEPCLAENITLQRHVCECYGYGDHIYDALLEDFETSMTVSQLEPMFDGIKEKVIPLIAAMPRKPSLQESPPARGHYGLARQAEFIDILVRELGFEPASGRMDTATHPFTTRMGESDIRMTTWYRENDPFWAIRAAAHECGHGLYQQGMKAEHFGTPMGSSASTGIDEGQARLYENMLGKSRAFLKYILPKVEAHFPESGERFELETVYQHLNLVEPGTKRVEADELTYVLHILLRFEIERDLLTDQFQVKDLPAIWNEKMKDYLGVTPTDDAEGVLQDPHWSDTYFGYFPTYALGNIYAAQIFEAITRDLTGFEESIARGEFAPLREWLREHIHQHGMRYSPAELIERATGSPPSSDALVRHLTSKYTSIANA